MKRLLALSLTIAVFFTLTSCGQQDTFTGNAVAPDSPTPTPGVLASASDMISLWTYPIGKWGDENTVRSLTNAFEAETGIEVNVEFLAYGDGDDYINKALSANQAPDVVLGDPEHLAVQWGAQGLMINLRDMIDEYDETEINASAMAAFTIDNDFLAGYPLCMNAQCMAINYTRFQETGVADVIDVSNRTWTTEGFITAVKALAETNNTVAVVCCKDQTGDQGTRALVNNLYSGKFINEDHTAYEWDSTENIKALKLLKKLKGVNFDSSISGSDEIRLFLQGDLDMAFFWNFSCQKSTLSGNEAGKTLAGDEVLFVNFPTDDGKVALCGGVWGFGIFNNNDPAKIEASKQFIKFVCDSTWTAEAVRTSAFFPARTATEGNDLTGIFAEDEDRNTYNITIIPNLGDYYTITPGFATVRPLWCQMLQQIKDRDVTALASDYAGRATVAITGGI